MMYPGNNQQPGNVGYPGYNQHGDMTNPGNSQPRYNQPGNVMYPAGYIQPTIVQGNPSNNSMQGVGVNQNQMVLVNVPKRPSRLKFYPRYQSAILGILQIICGVVSIILAGIAIGNQTLLCFIGDGFWCGILAIIAGVFGVLAGWRASKCTVTAHTVLSILAAIIVQVQIYDGITSAAVDPTSNGRTCYGYSYSYGYSTTYSYPAAKVNTSIALICFGFIEVAVAFWASMIGCHFCCCCSCCANYCCPCYSPTAARHINYNAVWVQMPQVQQFNSAQGQQFNSTQPLVGNLNVQPGVQQNLDDHMYTHLGPSSPPPYK